MIVDIIVRMDEIKKIFSTGDVWIVVLVCNVIALKFGFDRRPLYSACTSLTKINGLPVGIIDSILLKILQIALTLT